MCVMTIAAIDEGLITKKCCFRSITNSALPSTTKAGRVALLTRLQLQPPRGARATNSQANYFCDTKALDWASWCVVKMD